MGTDVGRSRGYGSKHPGGPPERFPGLPRLLENRVSNQSDLQIPGLLVAQQGEIRPKPGLACLARPRNHKVIQCGMATLSGNLGQVLLPVFLKLCHAINHYANNVPHVHFLIDLPQMK